MTYSDDFNVRTTSVTFNNVADAIDGSITRNAAGLTTGVANTYIATPTPAWSSYQTSSFLSIVPHVTNTGASTINVSGLGARSIKRSGVDVGAGSLTANVPTLLIDNGTHFEILVIENALKQDGTNAMLANINFGGFSPSNVAAGTAAAPAYCAGNDSDTGIFSPGANTLALSTGGTERTRIDSTGQELIGITSARTNLFAGGVTSIQQREHVISGATRAVSQVWNSNDTSGGYVVLGKTRGTATGSNAIVQANDQLGGISFQGADGTNMIEAARIQAFCGGTPGTNDMPGYLVFSTTADGAASVTERLRIAQDGNIGIDSTTPLEKFQIGTVSSVTPSDSTGSVGTILGFNTYYNAGLKALTTASRAVTVELGNAGGLLRSSTGTQTAGSALTTFNTYMEWGGFGDLIRFSTANTERMLISSSGNVGIGISPSYKLHVVSNTNTVAPGAFTSSASGDSSNLGIIVSKADNVSTSGSNYLIGFWINGGATASGRIATAGANAAAFFSTSDISLKENIVDLPSQLNNILALRPVEFDFKDGSGHQVGFIAQEVEQIYPDTVGTDADGIKSLGDMSKSYARLVKAFQEQYAYVQSLEARITTLEGA